MAHLVKEKYNVWIKLLVIGIKNTSHILGIGNFIIGGGVSQAEKFNTQDVLNELEKIMDPQPFKEINLEKATLGNDANILGIASLVFEKLI